MRQIRSRMVRGRSSIRRTVDYPGRHPARLVRRPRPGRQLGTPRPRRHPRHRPGRLPPPPDPVVRHRHRPGRHRRRARLRPRPPPLDPRTRHRRPAPANRRRPRRARHRPRRPRPPGPAGQPPPGPDAAQAAQLNDLLRRLNVTLNPIAKGKCDHKHQDHRYTPGRLLAHLIRARTLRCTAPGCGAQACYGDLDHSTPHPAGRTCECGLGPLCRRHHRCKQAPAGSCASPGPASCAGPPPPAAPTPPGRPCTTCDEVSPLSGSGASQAKGKRGSGEGNTQGCCA
jgi:hypothetical protein